jgi:hypothetical protein
MTSRSRLLAAGAAGLLSASAWAPVLAPLGKGRSGEY